MAKSVNMESYKSSNMENCILITRVFWERFFEQLADSEKVMPGELVLCYLAQLKSESICCKKLELNNE
ncbi:MAG: hypothetical protein PHE61_08615 [Candidatus Omnitrophica bacterium]|nr:hypothetical protein [Candidatus Omnitrophota bacterium]